jgi:NHLM bacteriocin system ABC transporter ATP-binding protein
MIVHADAPAGVQLLRSGTVTVFLARAGDAPEPGPRTPVLTLEGPALVALDGAPPGWRWDLGRGLQCDVVEVDGAAPEEEGSVRIAASRTVDAIGELLRPAATPPPEQVVRLNARPTYLAAGRAAVVDDTAWATPVEGAPTLIGVPVPESGAPLPPRLALAGARYTIVSAAPLDTVALPRLIDGVAWLFRCGADEALRVSQLREEQDIERVVDGPAKDAAAEDRGVQLLAAELAARPERVAAPTQDTDPLVACATIVGSHTGLSVTTPSGGLRGREGTAAVRAIAVASRLYVRRVSLLGRWWERTISATLGFDPDGTPVALIPSGETMVAIDAAGGRREVDETVAATLLDTGFVFSEPLDDEVVDSGTLLKVATTGRLRLAAIYVAWGAVIAALGLAVPRAAGVVFGEIIPESDRTRLWALTGVLVALAVVTLPLQLAFSIAKTRLEAPAAFDVQRGLFGRVLRTPASSIQAFGVGDVTVRLHSLEMMRDPLDQTILGAAPALLSGLLAGAVLVYYDASLAIVGLGTGLVCLGVAIWLSAIVARRQREVDAATGVVSGFLLQVLIAIPKLRVAAAEARAFYAWAERFRHAVGQRLLRASANQLLFTAMIQTIGTLALFAGVSAIGPEQFDVGVFMAFQTTYGLFLGGIAAVIAASGTAMLLRPSLARAVELAAAPMETSAERTDPGMLRGAIAFADVRFRYQANSRPVLDGLSYRVEPSEMVAIAGQSGCGKSTMIRMLLGFEHPEEGSVLYDDQDLTSLDVEAVRRQLGVVLQDGQLAPGTLRENIAGVATMSDAELWELAAIVALDEDIKAMPMGMDTVITLNGGAFSGGQRQRLLIARALANRPRILLLDEATSALDNVTQRVITDNLAQLGMTRIVIAHRLSTMVDADRILVMESGRIVEQGDFNELMARRGRFFALASRQLLEETSE